MSDFETDPNAPSLEFQPYTIAASHVEAHTINLPFNGRPLVTIDLNDGSMAFGPDYEPDEAARLFWQAVKDATPTPAVREFGPALHARINEHLASGQKAEEDLEQLRAEVRMLCGCCGDNRDRMRRIHALLGLTTDEFDLTEEENSTP